jgi:hypothetical protein
MIGGHNQLTHISKETGMELETREDLEIIDAGIEIEELDGPDGLCCWGPLTPFRL